MPAVLAPAPAALPLALDQLLTRHLTRVATEASAPLKALRRLSSLAVTDCQTADAFEDMALCAAYLAFRTVCAAPDDEATIATFDWTGQWGSLLKYTKLTLERDLQGQDSVYGDHVQRNRLRKDGAQIDAYQWSSWRHGSATVREIHSAGNQQNAPRDGAPIGDLLADYIDDCAPEVRAQEEQLSALRKVIKPHLTDREYYFIVEFYWNGKSQVELGQELFLSDPRYRTQVSPAKATIAVGTALCRARQKLARTLGGNWAELAKEIA